MTHNDNQYTENGSMQAVVEDIMCVIYGVYTCTCTLYKNSEFSVY